MKSANIKHLVIEEFATPCTSHIGGLILAIFQIMQNTILLPVIAYIDSIINAAFLFELGENIKGCSRLVQRLG